MNVAGERQSDGGEYVPEFDASVFHVAAHELKSPLALIRQLTLELQEADEVLARRLSEQIILTSEKALRLTTNLTKVHAKQAELFSISPINPRAVVADVQRELTPLYRARSRELHFSSVNSLPLIATNHDILRRILANFADNALHYAAEDGTVELFAQLKRSRGCVRLGVRDYGPQVPLKDWNSLKTLHAQQVSSRPDGSGLGLMISHRFASGIAATIGATRHRDGASFFVDVPISKQLSLL